MTHLQPTPDEFQGFDEARQALWAYEARAHTYEVMTGTVLADDDSVAYVYVNDYTRIDRMTLTAFDTEGTLVGSETIYNDDGRGLPITYEFSLRATGRAAPAGSDLTQMSEDGWIIDMAALRGYEPIADRRRTQKAIVLANLRDMIAAGDASCFLFGKDLLTPES